jgi:hypothetical protein
VVERWRGWWVDEEVTVETKVSCRAGHTTQAPDPEKKDKIQSDVRIVPTQQQVDGQQLLPLFVLLDFQGAAGVLVRGREDKRRGVTGTSEGCQ